MLINPVLLRTLRKQIIPITVNYGYLYNWYVVGDARGIANVGWHVPTPTEVLTLANYLGGQSLAGGKLKEVGVTYWDFPNTSATNVSQFNSRGGGNRWWGTGAFGDWKLKAYFWSTARDSTTAYVAALSNTTAVFDPAAGYYVKKCGASIRLIKDTTTLTNGQTGLYVDNSGNAYRTICIGTQEWLADNLVESKYRDGSSISVVTDSNVWKGLTTPAMCAFNNNILNV